MAVAMEVAWRGVELGGSSSGSSSSSSAVSKKRAWGADTEKLMYLMMGQFGAVRPAEVTLDLLGAASAPCPARELDSPEFLELDPDQPLPSGWEKCLDLKTGEVYFVSKSAGVRTSEDPRKQQPEAAPLAHEFLGSKMSETLREESLRVSTSSGSSQQLLSFSTGTQLWNLQLDDRSTVSLNKTGGGGSPRAFPSSSDEESNLELNLNLSAGGTSPSPSHQHQSVCTMEMVEQALKRTEKAMGKREMLPGSSSFSSLTSEPNSWSRSSPSTSSSSSTSSRSAAHLDDSPQALRSSAPGGCEAESRKAGGASDALVMGACTRCLMYVMLHKSDPKCPRCGSEVPLDFTSPPSSKRQRVEGLIQAS